MNSGRFLPGKGHGVAETESLGHLKGSERLGERDYHRGRIWIIDISDKSRSETFRARSPTIDIIGVKMFPGIPREAFFYFLRCALVGFERGGFLF